MPPRMDAAGAVDAQNAPTAPWKTAQTAVSHSAHTHNRLGARRTERKPVNQLYTRNSGQSPHGPFLGGQNVRGNNYSNNALDVRSGAASFAYRDFAEVEQQDLRAPRK